MPEAHATGFPASAQPGASRASGLTEIVLLGGGHTHVEVVRQFGRRPEPGCRLTLVSRDPQTMYSGMLPGLVAGHYRPEECQIDLARLCRAAGVHLIHAEAEGLDRKAKRIVIRGAPPLDYDTLSIDIGITPLMDEIEGAAAHAVAVKPISRFLPQWDDLLRRCGKPDGPRAIAAVGGGPAGFELILAMRHRLLRDFGETASGSAGFSFALVTGGRLLDDQNRRVQQAARRILAEQKVRLVEDSRVLAVDEAGLRLAGGGFTAADAVLVSTSAAAPGWLAQTGLERDTGGFVETLRTLQAVNDPDVFAVGDCATIRGDPRPKAGVFAVRQGPILAENLRRRLHGRPLALHYPQKRWLAILSTGDRYAIVGRGAFKAEGRWVWRWKNRIDRRWIDRYLPEPS